MKGFRIRPVDEDDVHTLVALAEKFMPKKNLQLEIGNYKIFVSGGVLAETKCLT